MMSNIALIFAVLFYHCGTLKLFNRKNETNHLDMEVFRKEREACCELRQNEASPVNFYQNFKIVYFFAGLVTSYSRTNFSGQDLQIHKLF